MNSFEDETRNVGTVREKKRTCLDLSQFAYRPTADRIQITVTARSSSTKLFKGPCIRRGLLCEVAADTGADAVPACDYLMKGNNRGDSNKREKMSDVITTDHVGSSRVVGSDCTGLYELYKTPGQPERALRCLIIGHNPSDRSWKQGHYYANPNNRMWSLLGKAGIIPEHFKATNDVECPDRCGVGFTDLMCGVAETQSSKFSDAQVRRFKSSLFDRIRQHVLRVVQDSRTPIEAAYPRVIAFAGVRQWKALFPNNTKFSRAGCGDVGVLLQVTSSTTNGRQQSDAFGRRSNGCETTNDFYSKRFSSGESSTSVEYGVQSMRPVGWPKELHRAIIFVLPSSSGAAALSNDTRETPYMELGRLLEMRVAPWKEGAGMDLTKTQDECSIDEEIVLGENRKRCRDELCSGDEPSSRIIDLS